MPEPRKEPDAEEPPQVVSLSPAERLAHDGRAIKDRAASMYLSYSAKETLGRAFTPLAFNEYLTQLKRDCGDSEDPIERMMIEQLALAHHNIGRLFSDAASCKTIDAAEIFNQQATRLLAEFRRLALALKKYREPMAASRFTVIRQQNNAAAQQVALIDSDSPREQIPDNVGEKNVPAIELESKGVMEDDANQGRTGKSAQGRGGEREP